MKKVYLFDTYSGDVTKDETILKRMEEVKHTRRYNTDEFNYNEKTHLLNLGTQGSYDLTNYEQSFEDENLIIYYNKMRDVSMVFFKPKNFDDSFNFVKIKATPNITAFLIQKGKYPIITTKDGITAMDEDKFEIISEEMHTKDIYRCEGLSSFGHKFDNNRYLMYNFYEKRFKIYTFFEKPEMYYSTSTFSLDVKVGDTVLDRSRTDIGILLSGIGEIYFPKTCIISKTEPYNLIKIDPLKNVNTRSVVISDDKYYIAEYDIKQRKILFNGNTYTDWYQISNCWIEHINYDIFTSNPYLYINSRKIYLQKDCVMCPECGETMMPDQLKTHICKVFCKDCGKELTTPEEIKFKRCANCQEDYVNNYNDHWAKKKPIFEKPDERNKFLHFGIELELDQDDDDCDMFDDCLHYLRKIMNPDVFNPMCYFEEDGSLSEYGIETVWNPKTIDWFRNNKEYITRIFDVIKDNGYTSESNGRCGLHIHIDRTYLGKRERYISAKIVYFVNMFLDDYFLPLSRRKNLDYCHKVNIKQKDDYRTINRKIQDNNRYVTVNCENSNTIEFRLWRGTLNPDTFLATIEITNAIVEFCKNISLNKLQRCTFEDFVATLDDDTKKYIERRLGK